MGIVRVCAPRPSGACSVPEVSGCYCDRCSVLICASLLSVVTCLRSHTSFYLLCMCVRACAQITSSLTLKPLYALNRHGVEPVPSTLTSRAVLLCNVGHCDVLYTLCCFHAVHPGWPTSLEQWQLLKRLRSQLARHIS